MATTLDLVIRWLLRPLARFSAKAAARAEWLLVDREINAIPELGALARRFQRSPEGGWTIAADDVLRLYRLVLRSRPQHILELGTGIGFSAAVMALALRRLGQGRITSLEQLPKCIEIARSLIPAELEPFIRIIHAPPTVFRINRLSRWIYFCGYDWTPAAGDRFDFVVIDGPAGWIEDGELVSLDSGDIFHLLPHLDQGCRVYVDGRRSLVKKIKRYLSGYLRLVEHSSEHALFERTDVSLPLSGEIKITDAKLTAGIGEREMRNDNNEEGENKSHAYNHSH